MKESVYEFAILFVYVLAGVSGAIGGCGAASIHLLRPGSRTAMSMAYVAAYATIGLISGVMFAAYAITLGPGANGAAKVVPGAILAGLGISMALAGTNLSARWALKQFGIEVEMRVHPSKRKDL